MVFNYSEYIVIKFYFSLNIFAKFLMNEPVFIYSHDIGVSV